MHSLCQTSTLWSRTIISTTFANFLPNTPLTREMRDTGRQGPGFPFQETMKSDVGSGAEQLCAPGLAAHGSEPVSSSVKQG